MIRFKSNWYGILLTLSFVPGTLVCQMTDGVVLAPNSFPSFSPTGPNAAESGEAQKYPVGTRETIAAARRVALKMGRRLRCSSVTYRLRYAPSSRLAGGPF